MQSQRVFLAFDTGRGLAYVQASGWQRTYLLWTFRNFRGVPYKILNARQRKLVESLYSAGSSNLAGQLDEAVLIGTIEDFIPPSPVPASVAGIDGKAVSAISTRESDDTLSRSLREQLHAIHHRQVFPGRVRTAGAWALVAVMAVLSWQQLRSRPVVSASTPNPAVASQASVDNHLNQGQRKDQTENLRPATALTLPHPDTQPPTVANVASASPISAASLPATQSLRVSSFFCRSESQRAGDKQTRREPDRECSAPCGRRSDLDARCFPGGAPNTDLRAATKTCVSRLSRRQHAWQSFSPGGGCLRWHGKPGQSFGWQSRAGRGGGESHSRVALSAVFRGCPEGGTRG